MTAISMFAQPGRAIILADTAVTALTGELLSSTDKLIVFERAKLVVGWTGYSPHHTGSSRDRISSRLRKLGIGDEQSATLQALPSVLRDMHNENLAWLKADQELLPEERAAMSMAIAYWDERRAEPTLAMARTDAAPGAPAYAVTRVAYSMATDERSDASAFLREALGRDTNPSDPVSFDADRDGLRLLEKQRRIPPTPWSYGHPSIGGRATLTVVDRHGVTVKTLKDWGDKLGKRIRVESPVRRALRAAASRW